MIGDNPDKSWEELGRSDPYYGVLSADRFRSASLDANVKAEFLDSGRAHMTELLGRIETRLGPVKRGNALDFGCGVGRLVLPLASQLGFTHVTGVDISPSMLAEATRNAREHGLDNVKFVLSDDSLSRLDRKYDFIHSVIVLQHIPAGRGQRLVQQLVGSLAPDGVAALHMPISRKTTTIREGVNYVRLKLRPLHVLAT